MNHQALEITYPDDARHIDDPMGFFEWVEALEKEDIAECGKVVKRSGSVLFQQWRSYQNYWKARREEVAASKTPVQGVQPLEIRCRDDARHMDNPMGLLEWIEALEKEDIAECGKVVERPPSCATERVAVLPELLGWQESSGAEERAGENTCQDSVSVPDQTPAVRFLR